MTEISAPMPVHDAIAEPRNHTIPPGKKDPKEGQCTDVWRKWLQSIVGEVQSSSSVTDSATVSEQSGDVLSGLLAVVLNSGFYRVSVYARVVSPASVSSSISVTLRWLDGGVACSYTPSAETGNTTSAVSQYTWAGRVDGGTQITYDVNYDSVGSAMLYSLRLVLEKVQA